MGPDGNKMFTTLYFSIQSLHGVKEKAYYKILISGQKDFGQKLHGI